jgi:four helix bundle protein
MATLKSFEDLDCWKASFEVKIWVMEIIKQFPCEEKYDLIDNMKRAANSTTRNIAEGFGRYHYKENIQFVRIAKGSMTEVLDDAITAEFKNYISKKELEIGRTKITRALQLMNGYTRYLNSLVKK